MSIWIGIGVLGVIVLVVIILALAIFYMNNFNNKQI